MKPAQSDREQLNRERILARYLKVDSIKGDNRKLVRSFLLGALQLAVILPLLFYLRWRTVDGFAIGFTVFMVVLSLLFALGLHFQSKTKYHTTVPLDHSLADRIGANWLVACAFGPFIGWLITLPLFPLTEKSWQWQYGARVFFAVVLPLLTALPLMRYARGRAALIAVPLLIGITALPVLSCVWVIGDLHDGVVTSNIAVTIDPDKGTRICSEVDPESRDLPCQMLGDAHSGDLVQIAWLPHTNRVLKVKLISSVPRAAF